MFPVERIREATDTILSERGPEVLQYSTTEGMPELRVDRQRLSGRVPDQRKHPHHQRFAAGLDMIARIFLDEGDRVVVENPTYVGC
jgi:2-aminoadipate transaminase